MIYDLNKLNDETFGLREFGNPASEVDALKIRAILSIAERIEALVDIQGQLCEIQQKVLWQIESDK